MALKESTQAAGLPQSAGFIALKDHRPANDGPLAKAVFDAGACLLGKTNIPVALADWQADSPVYGRTNDPWHLGRTPGGSTGGGGAALAAGLTPLEIGSDIGGSIRVPGACCGVYGHRPSETAIPKVGAFPLADLPNPGALMGPQGPLARSNRPRTAVRHHCGACRRRGRRVETRAAGSAARAAEGLPRCRHAGDAVGEACIRNAGQGRSARAVPVPTRRQSRAGDAGGGLRTVLRRLPPPADGHDFARAVARRARSEGQGAIRPGCAGRAGRGADHRRERLHHVCADARKRAPRGASSSPNGTC